MNHLGSLFIIEPQGYPAGFEELIVRNGFTVVQRWGGYAGEPYGVGPELVIQFAI